MKKDMTVSIRRILIQNYKGIDRLEMEFPEPRMPGDPDILVIGSENGLGKTSIMECCSLLLLVLPMKEGRFPIEYLNMDIPDLLIMAGQKFAAINGDIFLGGELVTVKIKITRASEMSVSIGPKRGKALVNNLPDKEAATNYFLDEICSLTTNPFVEDMFMFFHSYRKVQEGNLELGMMVERDRMERRRPIRDYEPPMSAFKLAILHSLMSEANLFEFAGDQNPGKVIEALNHLMEVYAGGVISKLRPSPDNTVDFRVKPTNGKGESFTFDGLSSGQKEIISTLFLVWHHTRNKPRVVFIDEPELHLNAQWHRGFIKELVKLAPRNQYIMATHSVDVVESVDKSRCFLINRDGGKK